jgi:hypothetical protein
LYGCDDGDILTIELDFNQELTLCDDGADYLIFDTKDDPSESLSFLVPRNATTESIFTVRSISTVSQENLSDIVVPDSVSFNIDGSSVRFIYRAYNRNLSANELCELVPSADLVINSSNEASGGMVQIVTTFIDNDGDGIASGDEDLNDDGNLDNDDTDGDGIPNYLDSDDDGDNVFTSDELDASNEDGDNNPFTNPLDTDSDGIADYLDDDDDGDMTLTRFEDFNMNGNPRDSEDQVQDENQMNVFRYLFANESEEFTVTTFRQNSYTRTYTSTFTVFNAGLDIINATEIDFGTYNFNFSVTETPED